MEQNRLPLGWKPALRNAFNGIQGNRTFWVLVLLLSAFGMAVGIQGVRDQTWIGNSDTHGFAAQFLSGAFAFGMLGSGFQAAFCLRNRFSR